MADVWKSIRTLVSILLYHGRGPCTGRGNGGMSVRFDHVAVFTIQTNAVT
jgi:hypothetical protein